jgi:cytochrome c biogenesis factor
MKIPVRTAAIFSLLPLLLLPILLQAKNLSEITTNATGSRWYNSSLLWFLAALVFAFLLILVLRSGTKKEAPAKED